MADEPVLDPLDLALLTAMRERPRAGVLELSRLVKVARASRGWNGWRRPA
jgi:hypothetical protein